MKFPLHYYCSQAASYIPKAATFSLCLMYFFLLWDDPQQLELKKSREKKKENIHKSSKQYQ